MAGQKCDNCGKAISLEPDSNGGQRWYHRVEGDGGDGLNVNCADKGGTSKTTATPANKADKATSEGSN